MRLSERGKELVWADFPSKKEEEANSESATDGLEVLERVRVVGEVLASVAESVINEGRLSKVEGRSTGEFLLDRDCVGDTEMLSKGESDADFVPEREEVSDKVRELTRIEDKE